MATGSNQKQAALVRRIRFTSKGGVYTALFTSDRGNLYQYYKDTPNSTDPASFVPNFNSASGGSNVTLRPVINSSAGVGKVVADDYLYYVDETLLSFDGSGNCTTPGMTGKFRRDNGSLVVIDNICDVCGGKSFELRVLAKIGSDSVSAVCPVSINRYTDSAANRVTIGMDSSVGIVNGKAPDPYTIDDDHSKLGLKTYITAGGTDYDCPSKIGQQTVTYQWQRLTGGAWADIAGATGPKLEVGRDMVDTYTHFKVIVYLDGAEAGSDSVTIFDASDDLEVGYNIYSRPNATGAWTADYAEEFDDTMDPKAAIRYECWAVRDGDQISETPSWSNAMVFNSAGLKLMSVAPEENPGNPDGSTTKRAKVNYVIEVGEMMSCLTNGASPDGDYDVIVEFDIT